jgi:hypothetical protein
VILAGTFQDELVVTDFIVLKKKPQAENMA